MLLEVKLFYCSKFENKNNYVIISIYPTKSWGCALKMVRTAARFIPC